MKPFNLEEAKAGKPVCTRDGRPARIICFDSKESNFPIIALIQNDKNSIRETIVTYTLEGRYCETTIRNADLMMVFEKHEGWINIYRDLNGDCFGGRLYKTKEEAVKAKIDKYLATTISIEWGE